MFTSVGDAFVALFTQPFPLGVMVAIVIALTYLHLNEGEGES